MPIHGFGVEKLNTDVKPPEFQHEEGIYYSPIPLVINPFGVFKIED